MGNKQEFVFIVTSMKPRVNKRIKSFIDSGFSVRVYMFERSDLMPISCSYSIMKVGRIDDGKYLSRIKSYFSEIRKIVKQHNNAYFYLMGQDVASIGMLFIKRNKYIYEEADLVFTYIKKKFLQKILSILDKIIIKRSLVTVFTSYGFVNYHYAGKKPKNIYILENKIDSNILILENVVKQSHNDHLRIGFVGYPRFKSIYNFIDVFCNTYKNFEFHIFGGPIKDEFQELRKYENCIIHGKFRNPEDLPYIYSQIDVVLSTYDIAYDNVRYAEPNKIYEAIYFRTPIIVSQNTFLAEKVTQMNIGYVVDPFDDNDIIGLVRKIATDGIESKVKSIEQIPQSEAIDDSKAFVNHLITIIE